MRIAHMEETQARQTMREDWFPLRDKYNLSASDGYTDGFSAGRLWAAARLLDAFPELDKARVVKLLGIHDREVKQAL